MGIARRRRRLLDSVAAMDGELDVELDSGVPSWSDDDEVDDEAFVDVAGVNGAGESGGRDAETPPPIARAAAAEGEPADP